MENQKSLNDTLALDSKLTDYLQGFSKLDKDQRFAKLEALKILGRDEVEYLKRGGLKDTVLAEKFIENVLGYFQLPMGIATNFKIDNEELVIPMAVEETSIIAAASKTAKWVREFGKIETEVVGQNIIGQIQFAKINNIENFRSVIAANKQKLISIANEDIAASMVARGGGVNSIVLREIKRPDACTMAVLHVEMNAADAMGANIMNQVCEYLKNPLQELTGEKVTMCILSNLVDTKLTKVKITIENIDADLALRIEEASLFSELDPYRAATNNKGILNGIDPIVVATGNDWRAVEAGVHAYACRDGQYRSISKWIRTSDTTLVGTLCVPLIVGTVGGVTALHPTAKLALKMMNNPNANRLSCIAAAVGLVQNLGALKALTTVGIIEGHMRLHIKNLSLGAGAKENEMPLMVKKLEEVLALKKRVSLSHAIEALKDLRRSYSSASSVPPSSHETSTGL